jgi:hypothetical protein
VPPVPTPGCGFRHREPRAIGSYRRAISSTIPETTRVALALKKDEIQRDLPGMTRRRFLYNLSHASYQKNWGKDYRAPTAGEKFLAFLFRLIPKIGPLKALALVPPTPEAQRMFERSFNAALFRYRQLLSDFDRGHLDLINDNLDVGVVTSPGQYYLADETYAGCSTGWGSTILWECPPNCDRRSCPSTAIQLRA